MSWHLECTWNSTEERDYTLKENKIKQKNKNKNFVATYQKIKLFPPD